MTEFEEFEIFNHDYDGESIYDHAKDVCECFYTKFNPLANIMDNDVDEHGFFNGTINIKITYIKEKQ